MNEAHPAHILELAVFADGTVRARWERPGQANVDVVGKLDEVSRPLASLYEPHDYGRLLGEALFRDKVATLWAKVTVSSHMPGISLYVSEGTHAELNWGWLQAPFAGGWDFLGLRGDVCFSIYPASEVDRVYPKMGRTPPRALLLVASPPKENRLRLEPFETKPLVESVGAGLGEQVPLDVLAHEEVGSRLGPPSLETLARAVAQKEYPIVHLVAHGRILADGRQVIFLDDGKGGVDAVDAELLVSALSRSALPPRLLFLSACHGASPAGKLSENRGNLAWSLAASAGIPAIVAMSESVTLAFASDLVIPFYRGLLRHGLVERALVEARSGLSRHDDAMVPVVYSRLRGLPLFTYVDDGPIATELEESVLPALIIARQRRWLGRLSWLLGAAACLLLLVFAAWRVQHRRALISESRDYLSQALSANEQGEWARAQEKAKSALILSGDLEDEVLRTQARAQLERARYMLPQVERWFEHPEPLLFHDWLPDQQLLTISPSKIRIWRQGSTNPIRQMEYPPGKLGAADVSPDGTHLLTAFDRELWLWDLERGEVVAARHAFNAPLVEALFATDEPLELHGFEYFLGDVVFLRDAQGLSFYWNPLHDDSGDLAYAGNAILTSNESTNGYAEEESEISWLNHAAFEDVVYSNQGFLATKGFDGSILIWNVLGEKLLNLRTSVHKLLGFHQEHFIALDKQGTVWTWSIALLKDLTPFDTGEDDFLVGAVGPSGKKLILMGADEAILWSEKIIGRVAHEDRVVFAEISPLGDRAITVDRQGGVITWELRNQIKHSPREIVPRVRRIGFENGKLRVVYANLHLPTDIHLKSLAEAPELVAVSADECCIAALQKEAISFWDSAEPGRQPVTVSFPEPVTSLALSDEGMHLAIAGESGLVHIYHVASGLVVAIFDGLGFPVRVLRFGTDHLYAVDDRYLRHLDWRYQ